MSAKHLLKMSKGKIMEGVFAINKPSGISSAQVIRDLQTHFNPSALFAPMLKHEAFLLERQHQNRKRRQKKINVKIGHGGTLDPLATGVLITGIGKGTKSLQDFLLCTKVYECIVLFGTATDSYDRVGKVLKRAPYEHVTRQLVEEKLAQFTGKFDQLPPLFSALKMNGKPLYEYAREGKPIPRDIERRPVEVLELEMLEWMEGGTHNHQAPSDEAGHAEINVANTLWKQEGVVPGSVSEKGSAKDENDERELFERQKRKLNADQDELVTEMPPSKVRRGSGDAATMSGGLPVPESEAEQAEQELGIEGNIPIVKSTIEDTSSSYSAAAAPETVKEGKGPPAAKLRMVVTSGFYVRTLCHDLGVAVGSAALMAELKRTRQGDFEVGTNVLEYDDLQKGEGVWGPEVERMLDDWNAKSTSARQRRNTSSEDGGPEKSESRSTKRAREFFQRKNSPGGSAKKPAASEAEGEKAAKVAH